MGLIENEALIIELKKRLGLTKHLGTIGDSDDLTAATVDEPGRPGYVRVRLYNDDVPYRAVKCGLLGGYSPYPGSPVVVGYDEKGDMAIEKADFDALLEANVNPLVFNSSDPRISGFNQTDSLLPLWCGAVSEELGTASTAVAINTFRYVDNDNVVHWFQGGKVDLVALIPAANTHRYVALFLKSDETVQIVGSTAIASITPLQETDKQECFDARDFDTIPIWLWRLHDNQSSITNEDKVEDLRPWLDIGHRKKNTTRVTTTYTALASDEEIYADSDGGAFTVTLPAGVDGQNFRIHNVGTSGNDVTIDGNGAETVKGQATQILIDAETLEITFETTEHWW